MKAMIRWMTLCALILVAPIASGMVWEWGRNDIDDSFTATLTIDEGGVYYAPIFNLVFVSGTTGTYTANAITDPEFAAFVSHLQNGVSGTVVLTLTGNSSNLSTHGSDPETVAFSYPLPENITGITMTVNEFTLIHDGNWTQGHCDVSFTAVPEPSSFFLSAVGVVSNQLRLVVSGTSNMTVIAEACTNLSNPIWSPLQTNLLTNGSCYFNDSDWTNYPNRFYRARVR